jgi:TRAP-type mannitol/chloroaromatic compound transport system permease small subunit
MRRAMLAYVRVVDGFNRGIGRITMYGIFVMMGILLWSTISKAFFNPSLWTLEMAQFAMVAYYILGGPYSIQLGSNVRMDLFYGAWTQQKKAKVDSFTILFLLFYLVILLWGGISSLAYSLGNFSGDPFSFFGRIVWGFVTGGPAAAAEQLGHLERSATSWRPYMWPVKLLMVIGFFLMFLQAVSEFCKDVLRARGVEVDATSGGVKT